MRPLTLAAVLLALVAVPLGCGSHSEAAALATVDGQKIEPGDVESLVALYRRRSEAEPEGEGQKRDELSHAQEVATLQVLVQRAVIEQKAKQLGIAVDPHEVEERAKTLRGRGPDTADEESELEQQFRDTARAQLLSEALYRRVTRNVRVSEAKVLTYYRRHLSLYRRGGAATKRPSRTVEQSIRKGLMVIARDETMARWLQRVRREFEPKIIYGEGWAPRS